MKTKINDLNDDLSDLIGGSPISDAMDILRSPRPLPTDPQLAHIRETIPEFVEQCPKCGGTGRFTSWSGRQLGECFACKGRGSRSFKTPPDQRVRAQAARATLPVRRWEAFKRDYPAEAAWISQKASTFDFADKMGQAVEKYGSLTDGQMEAVRRCMVRDRPIVDHGARETDAFNAVSRAEAVDASKIVEAIRLGKESGLIWITLRFDGIVIKEAKKYPGVLYVVHSSKTDQAGKKLYLGKIAEGKFFPARACTPEDQARIILIASDPASAAKVYGNKTNRCCVCDRALTNKQSVEEGIGPICAGRVGFTPGGIRVPVLGDSRPTEF